MNVRFLPALAAIFSIGATLPACITERPDGGDSPRINGGNDTAVDSGFELDGDNDGREDGINDPVTANGATIRFHKSIAPAGVAVTTSVETVAYLYGGGFGGDPEAGEDDWCDTDRPMGYDDGYWELYLPAGDYLLNAGRYQACSSDSSDTWFNLEGEAMASDPWLYMLENGDGYALCVHSNGERLTIGNWSVCNTLDDVSREERDEDPYDSDSGNDSGDSGSDNGDSGNDSGDSGSDNGDSGSLVREVCIDGDSGDFDLGYLLMNNSSDTVHWVSDNGSIAVVSSPLLTEGDSDGCATITLNSAGELVKFNGWAENSGYWHEYFVGTGTTGYCSGTTCAVAKIYVDSTVDGDISADAERATISGSDLVWTD